MNRSRYRIKDYQQAGQLFHWATQTHYVTWFTGTRNRHKRTETVLPKLVRDGKLLARRYQNRLVYSVPRHRAGQGKDPGYEVPAAYKHSRAFRYLHLAHGLACTEALVRFWRSRMADSQLIPERTFRGSGVVPEWGIRYRHSGHLLLYEFCTADNFYRTSHVKNKMAAYRKQCGSLQSGFAATTIIVLFVLDVAGDTVQRFVSRAAPTDQAGAYPHFFFTDYAAFLGARIGNQLSAPIYFWEGDGQRYPLGKDA